jgi:hypothetical protein
MRRNVPDKMSGGTSDFPWTFTQDGVKIRSREIGVHASQDNTKPCDDPRPDKIIQPTSDAIATSTIQIAFNADIIGSKVIIGAIQTQKDYFADEFVDCVLSCVCDAIQHDIYQQTTIPNC